MKRFLYPALLSLAATSAVLAADPPKSAPPAAPAAAGEAAAVADAEEAWRKVEVSQRPPTTRPTTREEEVLQTQTWLAGQRRACESFAKDFPKDPRRWTAKLLALRAKQQEDRLAGKESVLGDHRAQLDEIIKATDAKLPLRAEAAFMRAGTYAAEFKVKPESYIGFHEAAADFAVKYPAHPLSIQIEELDLLSLADDPTPQGAELIKKYLASSDPRLAPAAKKIKAKRDLMAELRSKPLELKFTSTIHKDVDLTLLRGKVVLVDFWGSFSVQCMAEMPNRVATYQTLRPKGFEIIGISLDEDKIQMKEALKMHGMDWPQYCDGLGWKNKISSGFLIDSVPMTWLIDKKGRLRQVGLFGPGLESAIQKLLAE